MLRSSTGSYKSGSSLKAHSRSTSSKLFRTARLSDPDSPRPLEWKHLCPCDAHKPPVAISVSMQCLCEEIDYEKELTLFFYDTIIESVCLKKTRVEQIKSLTDVSTSALSVVSTFILDTPKTKFYKKDIRQVSKLDLKKTLYSAGGNLVVIKKHTRSGSKSAKEKTQSQIKLNRVSSIALQPSYISEDIPSEPVPDKQITTTDFEVGWLVKRDEKSAKMVFKNGNVYEGDVVEKIPHGKGTFWWTDGTVYEGEFANGTPTGTGTMQLPDLTEYTGSFYNGYFHGNGVYNIRTTNMVYSGEWKYGKKHGKGWLLYKPGVWYEGEFKDDFRHGKGFFQFENGSCYEGSYVRNKREGRGAMRWFNNDVYIGEWKDGLINGFGEYTWKTVFDNTFSFPVQHYYKGSWVNSKKSGTGIMHFGTENGAKMAGIFHEDFKHGAAVVICGNGRSIEKNPLFYNDKPVHLTLSTDDLIKDSSSDILNEKLFKTIVKGNKQMPSKFDWSQVTTRLLEKSKQERGVLCNPIEIQIHSPPDDIELSFYIEKALTTYTNAFDTIQFEMDSTNSSYTSATSKNELSKWNLMTLSSGQAPSRINRCGTQDKPVVYARCSINQPTNFIKSDKFHSAVLNEEKYLRNVLVRHLPKLMEIYYHYATITSSKKVYFKHYMIRMFLWQMYLDMDITKMGISLVEIDKLLDENPASYLESCHHPFEHIYFYQFIHSLLGTALLVHYKGREEFHSTEGLTPYIFQKFLLDIVFTKAGTHKGRCLFEFKDLLPIKNVYAIYLKLGEPHTARTFLNAVCTKKGHEPPCYKSWFPHKNTSQDFNRLGRNVNSVGHNFLYIPDKEEIGHRPEEPVILTEDVDPFFRDLTAFRVLGPKTVVQCLYTVCPPIIQNGVICNMDYLITFLEFYEVLICCTLLYIAKSKKKREVFDTITSEEFKMEENGEEETLSKKGMSKAKKKK